MAMAGAGWVLSLLLSLLRLTEAVRCYTDLDKTKVRDILMHYQHTKIYKMGLVVKPESKSPIPCPNRPQILTLRSDQVEKTQKPNSLDWG